MIRLSASRADFARALLSAAVLSLTVAACGGGSDPATPITPVTPTVTVTAVSVSPGNSSLAPNETATFTAAVTTSTGSGASAFVPVWSSSATSVATVGQDGVVRAIAPGTATISAVAGGKTGTAAVLVLSVTSVAVSPATSALVEGDTRDLQATATLSNASSAVRTATWSSSATTVATVSNTGQVTAVAAGAATITATVGGTSGTATVTVARRVATITLDVSARALTIGELLTITPRLAFSDNAPVTGKTVTWTSSTPAVASVSAAGVVTAFTAGSTTISATVDGRVATALITVRSSAVTVLNTTAATTATIGPKGGVLTTTASGVTYRLEVPAGAVPINTSIRMTPVVSIGNLSLSGGLVAAADLQPSGLTFARPALLRMGLSAPARAGLTLVGFSLTESNGRTTREMAAARSTEVVVSVPHFSVAGAAFGTTQDVQSMAPAINRNISAEQFVNTFISLASSGGAAANLLQALIGWFDSGVLPTLQAATTDQALVSALGEYESWATDAFLVYGTLPLSENDPALQVRRLQFANALSPKLLSAVQQNNSTCSSQRSLNALQNVLFWQTVAQSRGVATGALSRASVLASLCASVVVTSSSFPDPVQSDFPNDLDVAFALKFGSNPTVTATPVAVTFTSSGATFAKSSPANSDAAGAFTVAVTATGNTPFTVNLFGCLALAGAEDVCGLHAVNGTSLNLTGAYTGRFSSRIQTSSGATFPVNVPINVSLVQNQNSISGTYQVMQFNGPRGSVSATLTGNDLLNFSLSQFLPCPGSLRGAAQATLPARTIRATYTGSDCTGTHSNGVTDLALGTTSLIDFSGAWADALHASGLPMRMWKVRQLNTTVFLEYSTLDVDGLRMQCRAQFRGTVTAGSEVFSATLTGNLSPFDDFSAGARTTWNPDLTFQRAARITTTGGTSTDGPRTWGLLGVVPSACSP